MASAFAELVGILGYARYGAQGGDRGAEDQYTASDHLRSTIRAPLKR